MIIMDFNQVCIANIMQQAKHVEYNEDLIRHMVFNSIKMILKKFRLQYGELVIATDSKNYWRKDKFKYYKINRKAAQNASKFDWNMIHGTMNSLRDDLKNVMPYRIIHIEKVEADDIIAVLTQEFSGKEKILIVSGDKDFGQLQQYPDVDQFSPTQGKFIEIDDPVLFLKEHIIRGDAGDGIPNILSPDDIFVRSGERQSSVYKKKLDVWLTQTPEEICTTPEMMARWNRNQELIDFHYIPTTFCKQILTEYSNEPKGNMTLLRQYFQNNKLAEQLKDLTDYVPKISV